MASDQQDGHLEALLRQYFNSGAPALDPEEMANHLLVSDRRLRLSWLTSRRVPLVLGVVVIGAGLVVGSAVANWRGPVGGPQERIPSGSSPLFSPPRSAAPTRTASPAEAWTERTIDPTADQSEVFRLQSGAGRLIAVGSADVLPAIWISVDAGETWHISQDTPSLDPGSAGYVWDVLVSSGRFVVAGWSSNPSQGTAGLLWVSRDGVDWEAVDLPGAPPQTRLTRLAAGAGRIIVAGESPPGGALLWISRDDGSSWQVTPAPPGAASITAIAWAADRFVAIGPPASSPTLTAVWTSPDGAHWKLQPVQLPEGISRVAIAEEGLVAVGGDRKGHATVWLSPDGASWQVAAEPPDASGLVAVASTPDGLVALEGREPGVSSLWRSTTGQAWTRDATFDFEGALRDVLSVDGGLIVVGVRGTVATAIIGAHE